MSRRVELTDAQANVGGYIGAARQANAMRNGMRNTVNGSLDIARDTAAHVLGARGELVVALVVGAHWDGSLTAGHQADVLPDWQVRTVRAGSHERLIVRPADPDAHRYVLVLTHSPTTHELIGWIYGHNAKADRWKRDPGKRNRPCWMLPHSALETWPREGTP